MDQYIRTAIFIEMLIVNLLTSHYCMQNKYKITKIIVTYFIFTFAVVISMFILKDNLDQEFLRGDIVLLLGFVYFFPLKYLYNESAKKILSIMFFSFTHTITVTFYSLKFGNAFHQERQFIIALIIQSLVFLVTTNIIIKFVKTKFIYILQSIPEKMTKYLVSLSMTQFLILFVIHLYFNKQGFSVFRELAYFITLISAILGYNLLYLIVKGDSEISYLQKIAYKDTLTKIGNRYMFLLDAKRKIKKKIPFSIVYMDLNEFKSINDTYGHEEGDIYLKEFVDVSQKILKNKGKLYRMSGDEFVFLSEGEEKVNGIDRFSIEVAAKFDLDKPFLGVCCGCASYPNDGEKIDTLLLIADKKMYQKKKRIKASGTIQ